MLIFNEVKRLAQKEKHYTALVLKKLMVIERDKLYCDLKYPSLFKYLVKELGYSDAEAGIRVQSVRLMLKSKKAEDKIEKGELTLTNAAEANRALGKIADDKDKKNEKLLDNIVEKASQESSRNFKEFIQKEFQREFNEERREVLVLNEQTIAQFDRLRQKYGNLPTWELIQIMLEKELKAPAAPKRDRPHQSKNSRSIPQKVKFKVYNGKCQNCEVRYNLEYDHITKHSHGGTNDASNIQVLCRQCNLRREIKARQSGFFA